MRLKLQKFIHVLSTHNPIKGQSCNTAKHFRKFSGSVRDYGEYEVGGRKGGEEVKKLVEIFPKQKKKIFKNSSALSYEFVDSD